MAKKKKSSGNKSSLAKRWAEAREQAADSPGFGVIAPGPAVALIIGGECTIIGDNDWPNFALQMKILEGEDAGTLITHRCGLKTAENLVFLIRDLTILGYNPDDLEIDEEEDLNAIGAELKEDQVVVRINATKENDSGFQNYRLKKVLEDYVIDEATGAIDEPDEVEESEELKVGSRVTVTIEGEDYEGEIVKLGKKKATVKFDDGGKQQVPLDELESAAADSTDDDVDSDDFNVGDSASFKKGKKIYVGIIKSIDDDGNFKLKTEEGKTIKGHVDDLESAETDDDDDDDDELKIGSRVTATIDDENYTGEITAIDDDEDVYTIEFDDDDVQDVPIADVSAE